ncbi:sce7726 family protein [Clostridium guangxiense]|uniref:sce7726 family protein n=1 Tax=Clostridium guangxiense TaxID=1662055 RepID=UPI001E3A82AF|nr:sce7726 family protein [Clostridium guangxiense]MCD2346853.1 sce7726 family protein [Clostridium guangxiense]
MEYENNLVLKRLFTKNTINNLIKNRKNDTFTYAINRYLNETKAKKYNDLISKIYKLSGKQYRMEYFYKNTLLNKLLLGKHSLKTTTALTELAIGKSKADFVMINGKGIVYEIKTELDTLERLENQIQDYYKVFKYVCVVTCEEHYEKLREKLLDTKVGIYILTKRNTISVKKEPEEEESFLDKKVIFKVLRKKEYEKIIFNNIGYLPETSQFKYYNECYKLFEEISIEVIHKSMLDELKKRINIDIQDYKNYVPYELKFLIYFSQYKKKDYQNLKIFLQSEFGG